MPPSRVCEKFSKLVPGIGWCELLGPQIIADLRLKHAEINFRKSQKRLGRLRRPFRNAGWSKLLWAVMPPPSPRWVGLTGCQFFICL